MKGLPICPVCKSRKVRGRGFDLLIGTNIFGVCYDCYHKAYIKTNDKALFKSRGRWRFSYG